MHVIIDNLLRFHRDRRASTRCRLRIPILVKGLQQIIIAFRGGGERLKRIRAEIPSRISSRLSPDRGLMPPRDREIARNA